MSSSPSPHFKPFHRCKFRITSKRLETKEKSSQCEFFALKQWKNSRYTNGQNAFRDGVLLPCCLSAEVFQNGCSATSCAWESCCAILSSSVTRESEKSQTYLSCAQFSCAHRAKNFEVYWGGRERGDEWTKVLGARTTARARAETQDRVRPKSCCPVICPCTGKSSGKTHFVNLSQKYKLGSGNEISLCSGKFAS